MNNFPDFIFGPTQAVPFNFHSFDTHSTYISHILDADNVYGIHTVEYVYIVKNCMLCYYLICVCNAMKVLANLAWHGYTESFW